MHMSAVETLAHLLTEYEAAKREHLAAWSAVHGDFLAADAGSARPPGLHELQRLAAAQTRRRAVEALLAERMEVEADAPVSSLPAASPARKQPVDAELLQQAPPAAALPLAASP
jgi:hypothetical protein